MDDNKKKRITILEIPNGSIFDEGVIIPSYNKKPIVMNSTKRYHNCIYLLAGLSPVARNLMDFLVEEMDNDNIVRSDKVTRDKFISFMHTITVDNPNIDTIQYKDSTVKEAFGDISKTKLLKSLSRGVFKVNPEYFTSTNFNQQDENKRVGDIIKMELEFLPQGTNIRVHKNYK